jgi:hypothetical protein
VVEIEDKYPGLEENQVMQGALCDTARAKCPIAPDPAGQAVGAYCFNVLII